VSKTLPRSASEGISLKSDAVSAAATGAGLSALRPAVFAGVSAAGFFAGRSIAVTRTALVRTSAAGGFFAVPVILFDPAIRVPLGDSLPFFMATSRPDWTQSRCCLAPESAETWVERK
jgi:hypothetical protein